MELKEQSLVMCVTPASCGYLPVHLCVDKFTTWCKRLLRKYFWSDRYVPGTAESLER